MGLKIGLFHIIEYAILDRVNRQYIYFSAYTV